MYVHGAVRLAALRYPQHLMEFFFLFSSSLSAFFLQKRRRCFFFFSSRTDRRDASDQSSDRKEKIRRVRRERRGTTTQTPQTLRSPSSFCFFLPRPSCSFLSFSATSFLPRASIDRSTGSAARQDQTDQRELRRVHGDRGREKSLLLGPSVVFHSFPSSSSSSSFCPLRSFCSKALLEVADCGVCEPPLFFRFLLLLLLCLVEENRKLNGPSLQRESGGR